MAITPCAGFVNTLSALIIGAIAGVVCYLALRIKSMLNLDDALDVIGVHLVGGLVGAILLGLFATKDVNGLGADGLFFGGGAKLLGNQIIASVATIVWSGVMTAVIALAIHKTIGLRVNEDAEAQGLDISEHQETAYSFSGRI